MPAATSKAEALRQLDLNELNHRAAELNKEMFDLRMSLTTKENPDTSQIQKKRRAYARLLTVINELSAGREQQAQDGTEKKATRRKAAPKKKSVAKKAARKGGARKAVSSKKAAGTKKSTAHKQTKHTRTKSG
ncbi:50S ribosomal protein L29 [Candidatus Sumerlaeota bacterium]|nr:50S ribosomal protein L29 [Candidatus Sumerlaeota bacterium]